MWRCIKGSYEFVRHTLRDQYQKWSASHNSFDFSFHFFLLSHSRYEFWLSYFYCELFHFERYASPERPIFKQSPHFSILRVIISIEFVTQICFLFICTSPSFGHFWHLPSPAGAFAEVASSIFWVPTDIVAQKMMVEGDTSTKRHGSVTILRKVCLCVWYDVWKFLVLSIFAWVWRSKSFARWIWIVRIIDSWCERETDGEWDYTFKCEIRSSKRTEWGVYIAVTSPQLQTLLSTGVCDWEGKVEEEKTFLN